MTRVETENVSIRGATILDIPACVAMIARHEFGEIKYWQDRFEIDLANLHDDGS